MSHPDDDPGENVPAYLYNPGLVDYDDPDSADAEADGGGGDGDSGDCDEPHWTCNVCDAPFHVRDNFVAHVADEHDL